MTPEQEREWNEMVGLASMPPATFSDSIILAADAELKRLKNLLGNRADLQAHGGHPAPCARHCEANAFAIEIRTLKREREALLEALKRINEMTYDSEAIRVSGAAIASVEGGAA